MEKLFLVNYENIHKSVENGLDILKKQNDYYKYL